MDYLSINGVELPLQPSKAYQMGVLDGLAAIPGQSPQSPYASDRRRLDYEAGFEAAHQLYQAGVLRLSIDVPDADKES